MKQNLTRRQLLKRSALAGAMLSAPNTLFAVERQPLRIPPIIEVGRGRPVRLDLRPAQTQFNKGKLVDVWGVNGQYLAPTVRVKSDNFVKLTYVNNLPQQVSINIQGLLAPTEMIGSAHRKLAPKSSWSPILSIHQPACTCWYHADTMLNSAFQLYRGLAGLWIIEDANSKTASLPNKYGVNDIPLVLQDQHINKDGIQLLDLNQKQFFGKRLFVNGQESAYHNVARGWVRLRIVNASLSRAYELRLDNDKPLHVIATGMGMLAEPVEMPSVTLAPSARIEVLVDLNDGKTVSLISGQKRDIFYKAKSLFADNNDLVDNVILELRPEGMASVFTTKPSLPVFDLDSFQLKITQERRIALRPLDRLINQQRFDPKRIDFTIKQGSVERWYITSNEAVGFTLQGAKFIVETRDRKREPHKQLAWQDTVWLEKDQEVTLLVRFDHLASDQLPFTFGVSDFMLRDRGAMGQFTVEE
ncbi:multicopper oxidase domain-containing protein [Actinobacillus equuli]|uniref:Cell division protein FtsP n=1 Tax=Actinobacillus equuli TaxID=718 RepID=A0AAX3FKP7_ACTEU|nr:multicopper oxidase domain-containing protein [Actinobacillus equuli]AIZ80124.1 cell division protein FtsQ [Actinobacillus equuli subsp. equuli]WGE44232.1 multicopper oxidase domain-containing protein [Actinobacillus equuli subsp. equuli]VEE91322.1 protein SufI precursor [Actinobacillus equuli]